MQALIDHLFNIKDLIPHGYCLSWSPVLLWLHVGSDLLITLAYYSIPLMLVYFIRQRKDFPYPWLAAMFAGFIVACGTTHLLSAITIWMPLYWLDGLLKALTAIISIATAVLMIWIIPRALSRPSSAQLQAEIQQRKTAETAQHEAFDRLQKIACQLPGMVFQFRLRADGSSCFPFASEAICDIFRLSPEDVREDASKAFALVHPDDYGSIGPAIRKSARNLTPWHHEYRLRFADGTERWLFGNALPQREEDGSVLWHGFVTDISERKRMEEKLHDSDALNVSILDSLASRIAVLDAQGVIVAVNKAWRQFAKDNDLPESRQNMLGLNYLDICKNGCSQPHCNDVNPAQAGIAAVLTGERETFNLEYPCRSPTQQRWFHMNVLPLQGSHRGVVVSHENITERKLMEDELKASEAKFRSIIEVSPVPMALNDEQWNITFLNQAFVQTFGYNVDDIPTVADWQSKAYPDPDYRRWVDTTWQSALKKTKQEQTDFPPMELAIRCNNNNIKTVLASAAAIHHDFAGVHLVIMYDITQRKQIEAKLNSIFNASVEGIITFDMSNIIISANAAVEAIFGYKPEDLVGCNINKLMPASPKEMSDGDSSQAAESIGQIQEIEGIHKDGSAVPLDLSIAEFSIENEHYFTHIVRDVSLRKHREQQDKEHLDELAHVTRLGLMGEMASGIAHEINQPLAAISSYTQVSLNLINTEHPDLVKLAEILYKTQQQALRAGRIIHRMREFVKSHAKQRSTANINNLIHEAVGLCIDELKQNDIRLTFELTNNLPTIYVDHVQIEQVIINLIRNSVDALLNLPEKRQRQLTIHSRLTLNNDIQVRVKDNGPGLDEEQQQNILTPFYTTKTDGMGMGLSISRSLIEAHEGTLHFNSHSGKGTTMYFTLPIRRKSGTR
ncbi:PAS domain S-box protein [Methylobacter tundripaludum]|uniref:histidine kinase n=1 Tax=Methylobacter tundripaludum (strain ATCC BAA-1195 / DSM 17260 / SV96) TaxID=697282 RepID=G3IXN9_METTV|nr:PAS domain S-box protein [Methylobacter tundripaludum]EGW23448.1 multi-sensor signal transduction histidine kinase [Methylobacter tundripaludum SV96]